MGMILVDDRQGSRELAPLIPNSILTRLEFGDMAFEAQGKLIGLERKVISDAVNCLFSGRLVDHQLPGMRNMYDLSYLILEGQWRPEPNTGILQQWKEFEIPNWIRERMQEYFRRFPGKEFCFGGWHDAAGRGTKRLLYSQFVGWLTTLSLCGGIVLRTTIDARTTAALAMSLYQWHSKEEHHSFNVMQQYTGDGAELSRPSRLRRMIAHLPHIGWTRSGTLLERISGVQFIRQDGKIMNGEDWYIDGEIAEKSAEDIDRTCEGEWQ